MSLRDNLEETVQILLTSVEALINERTAELKGGKKETDKDLGLTLTLARHAQASLVSMQAFLKKLNNNPPPPKEQLNEQLTEIISRLSTIQFSKSVQLKAIVKASNELLTAITTHINIGMDSQKPLLASAKSALDEMMNIKKQLADNPAIPLKKLQILKNNFKQQQKILGDILNITDNPNEILSCLTDHIKKHLTTPNSIHDEISAITVSLDQKISAAKPTLTSMKAAVVSLFQGRKRAEQLPEKASEKASVSPSKRRSP